MQLTVGTKIVELLWNRPPYYLGHLLMFPFLDATAYCYPCNSWISWWITKCKLYAKWKCVCTISFSLPLFNLFPQYLLCTRDNAWEHICSMYMTVSPFLLENELLLFVSWASHSFDSSLARGSLTGSYFLYPMAKLGPENATVPGCSARAAELWLASSLLSLISTLRLWLEQV